MTRRVNKILPSQRALDDENRVRKILLKQASERHIGTGITFGDGMTGAPVIELEYKPCVSCIAVLDEINMATY